MESRYIHMTIEELVEDAEFILSIQSKRDLHTWSDWSKAQSVDVQDRVNKASLIVASLTRDIKHHSMDDSKVEQLWSRIEGSTKSSNSEIIETPKTRTIPMWVYVSSIAAALALLIIVNIRSSDFEIINNTESQMAVMLPSNSTVSLSQESTIQYDKQKWNVERNVKLDGRASFDVSKGVPFNVFTTEGSVHVLGTAFEVVEREDVFLVAVDRGLVRVESGLDKIELGQGMSYLKNPDIEDINELKGKEFTHVDFKNKTLKDAKLTLENLYGISFEGLEADEERKFTGSFDTNDLEEALRKVVWPANMKYEINESIVTLTR